MRKLLRWTVCVFGVLALGLAGLVLLVVLSDASARSLERWSAESGEPVPSRFRYLLFPTERSVSYDDPLFTTGERAWSRALLNTFPELANSSVGAWDVATSTRRHVNPATMTYLPADPDAVDAQLRAVVHAIGDRSVPRIRWIRFSVQRDAGQARVTLVVDSERSHDVYEYLVTDRTIVPRRWTTR